MADEKEILIIKEAFLKRLRARCWLYGDFLENFVSSVIQKGDIEQMNWLVDELDRSIHTAQGFISEPKSFKRYNLKQPETARNINVSLRYDILQRDGFKCKICGRNPEEDNVKLHVDHIKPFSKGGLTKPDNLRCLCQDCNLGKKAKYES